MFMHYNESEDSRSSELMHIKCHIASRSQRVSLIVIPFCLSVCLDVCQSFCDHSLPRLIDHN